MSCKVFMNFEAAFDYLDLKNSDADPAAILPKVDNLTNKDEF